MERLALERQSFRLVRVDVEEWDSPVSQQFGIQSLPTLHLYDGRELVSADAREVLEIVQR